MFYAGEVAERLAYALLLDAADVGGYACSQRVIQVVLARKRQVFLLHVEGRGLLYLILSLFYVADGTRFLEFGERIAYSLDVKLLQFLLDDGVVVPVNEAVLRRLVLCDAHLGVGIVLKLIVVAVQMVGGDVQQDGNVGPEVVHIVELKTAQLYDVILMWVFGHLQSQASAYVSGQSGIISGLLEDVVYQAGGGGLAIAARYAYHLRVCVSSRKFYLADDVCALLHELLYHGSLLGNARTLYHLVGVQNLFFRVMALLPFYVMVVKHLLVFVFNGRCVRDKHVEAFLLGQYSGSGATLTSS